MTENLNPVNLFPRVTVIGCGVIGCSLAALFKARGVAGEVVGVDRDPAHVEMARRLEFIDRDHSDPSRAVMGSHAVVLAIGLDEIFKVMEAIGPDLRPGAVVTCVAGTTSRLCKQIAQVEGAQDFVPSFPLAFTSKQGPGAASPSLLLSKSCLVASGDPLPGPAVEKVAELWSALGINVIRQDLTSFESMVSGVHLWPMLVSTAINRVVERQGWPESATAFPEGVLEQPHLDGMSRTFQLQALNLVPLLSELVDELNKLRQQLGGKKSKRPNEVLDT